MSIQEPVECRLLNLILNPTGEPKMFYLGIDQHARQLTVNLRDENGDVVLRRQVSTKPGKVLRFFEELTSRCAQNGCGFWAVVEVCGFNDWLLQMLKNFRCQKILLVQPEDSDKRKTDSRDAAAPRR